MNTRPKLICLCGYKRSGKDTAAHFISEQYGYEHKKIASPIKDLVKYLFLLNDDDVEINKEEINSEWGVSPRFLMQTIGTELFQYKLSEYMPHIGRLFWITRFKKNLDKTNYTVVSDLRFYHEYDMLKDYMKDDMIVIRIDNDNIDKTDMHISESEFNKIDVDYVISNNSTIEEFNDKIKNILE